MWSTSSSSSSSSASFYPSGSSASSSASFYSEKGRALTYLDRAETFLNEAQLEQMHLSAIACGKVVCQVVAPDGRSRGTGCLISPVLLLTSHCVLADPSVASRGFACFFEVVSKKRSSCQEESSIKTIKIPLDPDTFFFTSPNRIIRGQSMPASEGHLNFTVVALKPAPYLSKIQNSVLSVFDIPIPTVGSPICIIHCPGVMNSADVLQENLKWSYGQIREVREYTIAYNASTADGSDGGAVIDSQGRLIALHHQTKIIPTQDRSVVMYDRLGVSIQKIAAALQGQRAVMNEIIRTTNLPPDLSYGNVIGLPRTTNLFTGREKELAVLECACLGVGKRVAIVGLGGIGKTALVVKYANDHQSDYSLIYFIHSASKSQIEHGMLNLADVLKVREEDRELKLLALRTKLETNQDRLLLIFDGIDDEETLACMCELLPQRGCTNLIVSSRLRTLAAGSDFTQLSLTNFRKDEAVDYLLKAVREEDTNAEQRAILADELYCLPLALTHAAAFINSRRYTLSKYIEALRRVGVSLLGPDYVSKLNTREETILITWKKSMDTVSKAPQGSLAQNLLHLFSLFAEAPIPIQVLEQLESVTEEDIQVAIGHLTDHSLLEERGNSYVLHGLLRKVVSHTMLQSHRRDYIYQGVKILYNFSKNLDANDRATHRRLESYVPHFEVIIESAQEIFPIDSMEINLLFKQLFNYYLQDRKEISYKKIAELYLIRLKQQEQLLHNKKGDLNDDIDKAKCYRDIGDLLGYLGTHEEALDYEKRALEILKQHLSDDHLITADSYRAVGIALANLGRHEKAFNYQKRALEIRSKQLGDDHLTTADSYYCVGAVLSNLGRDEEALANHQRALEIREKQLGGDHLSTADSYCCVGAVLSDLEKNEEALTCHQRALEIREKQLGGDHLTIADSCYCVGAALSDLGRDKEALAYHQRALEIREKQLGGDHLTTADSYNLMAFVLSELGRYEEALAYDRRVLEIREKQLGDEDLTTADSYHCVGCNLGSLGRYEEALIFHQHALEIREKQLGDEDLTTAESCREVGITLTNLGRYKEAHSFVQRTLKIHKVQLGDEDRTTADSYREVGITLANLGWYEEALSYALKALEIRKEKLGDDHSATVESYGEVGIFLDNLGRHEEACSYMQRTLEIRKLKLGSDHPTTANSADSLGITLGKLGDYEPALKSKQLAFEIRKKILGDDHSDVAYSYDSIGVTLGELGRYEEALSFHQRALEIRKQKLKDGHSDVNVADSYYNLGVILGNQGKFKEALESKQLALEIRKKLLGDDHPDTANSYDSVGVTLGKLGNAEDALTFHQRALEIRKQKLGAWHIDVADSQNHLGVILVKFGKYVEAREYAESALEIRKQKLGQYHLTTADSHQLVGIILVHLKCYKEAHIHLKSALQIQKVKLRKEHLNTACNYYWLGVTFGYLSEYEKSLKFAKKALEIRENKLGKKHPITADSSLCVGMALCGQQKYSDAFPYHNHALEVRQELLGENDVNTADSYYWKGVTLGHLNDHDNSLKFAQDALKIRRKMLGEENPITADSWRAVGMALDHLGRYKEALSSHERALAIRIKTYGEDHLDTADSYRQMGVVQQRLGMKQAGLNNQRARKIREKLGKDHSRMTGNYFRIGGMSDNLGGYEEVQEIGKEKHLLVIRSTFIPMKSMLPDVDREHQGQQRSELVADQNREDDVPEIETKKEIDVAQQPLGQIEGSQEIDLLPPSSIPNVRGQLEALGYALNDFNNKYESILEGKEIFSAETREVADVLVTKINEIQNAFLQIKTQEEFEKILQDSEFFRCAFRISKMLQMEKTFSFLELTRKVCLITRFFVEFAVFQSFIQGLTPSDEPFEEITTSLRACQTQIPEIEILAHFELKCALASLGKMRLYGAKISWSFEKQQLNKLVNSVVNKALLSSPLATNDFSIPILNLVEAIFHNKSNTWYETIWKMRWHFVNNVNIMERYEFLSQIFEEAQKNENIAIYFCDIFKEIFLQSEDDRLKRIVIADPEVSLKAILCFSIDSSWRVRLRALQVIEELNNDPRCRSIEAKPLAVLLENEIQTSLFHHPNKDVKMLAGSLLLQTWKYHCDQFVKICPEYLALQERLAFWSGWQTNDFSANAIVDLFNYIILSDNKNKEFKEYVISNQSLSLFHFIRPQPQTMETKSRSKIRSKARDALKLYRVTDPSSKLWNQITVDDYESSHALTIVYDEPGHLKKISTNEKRSPGNELLLKTYNKHLKILKEQHPVGLLVERMLQVSSLFGDNEIPLHLLQNVFPSDTPGLDLAKAFLKGFSEKVPGIKVAENDITLHPDLRQAIRINLGGAKRESFRQAFRALSKFSTKLDFEVANSYIVLFGGFLESVKTVESVDSRYRHLPLIELFCRVGIEKQNVQEIATKILKILMEPGLPKDQIQVEAYQKLGGIFNKLGMPQEAIECCNVAIEMFEKASLVEKRSDKESTAFREMGIALNNLDRNEDALKYHMHALELRKDLRDKDAAVSYLEVGVTMHKLAKFEDALSFHVNALIIRLEVLGENDLEIATSYKEIAKAQCKLLRYEKALSYLQKALQIQRDVLGDNDLDTAESLEEIAEVMWQVGLHNQSVDAQILALTTQSRLLDDDGLLQIAYGFGEVAQKLNMCSRAEEALICSQRALEIGEKALGSQRFLQDPKIINNYIQAGAALNKLDRHQEALTYLEHALKILEQTEETRSNFAAANCYFLLGITLGKLGQHEKALTHLLYALQISRIVFKEGTPDIATYYQEVGIALRELGRYDEALGNITMARDIRLKLPVDQHSDMADTYYQLGLTFSSLGKYDDALANYKQGLEIFMQNFGENHAKVADSYRKIAEMLRRLNQFGEAEHFARKALEIRQKISIGKGLKAASYFQAGPSLESEDKRRAGQPKPLLRMRGKDKISNEYRGQTKGKEEEVWREEGGDKGRSEDDEKTSRENSRPDNDDVEMEVEELQASEHLSSVNEESDSFESDFNS